MAQIIHVLSAGNLRIITFNHIGTRRVLLFLPREILTGEVGLPTVNGGYYQHISSYSVFLEPTKCTNSIH